MTTITLSDVDFKILRSLIQNDMTDLAEDGDFFEQNECNPKEYIEERIALGRQFDLDLWKVVRVYCADFASERLKAIYNGKTAREFLETYEIPSQPELTKKFLKSIIESKGM